MGKQALNAEAFLNPDRAISLSQQAIWQLMMNPNCDCARCGCAYRSFHFPQPFGAHLPAQVRKSAKSVIAVTLSLHQSGDKTLEAGQETGLFFNSHQLQ
ncbi:hypothetical protein [Roseibium alexandrii]|uniref:hypothetical protein n=1 Tax=Roseibium alexandrii TaxID=388408 RepID=UPI00031B33CD|nr:hypothetical protein [Roseibium alexandrii]